MEPRTEPSTDSPAPKEGFGPSPDDWDAFYALARAFEGGRAALMEARRRSDGAWVAAVCAVETEGGRLVVSHLATLVGADPSDHYDPPGERPAGDPVPQAAAGGGDCPECGSGRIGIPQTLPGVALGRMENGTFVPMVGTSTNWSAAAAVPSPLGTVLGCAACGARWVYPSPAEEPGGDEATPAAIPFSVVLDECLEIVARLKDAIDDHLGMSPDKVTWGHAADAGRIRRHLRHAAFVAGVGDEPAD